MDPSQKDRMKYLFREILGVDVDLIVKRVVAKVSVGRARALLSIRGLSRGDVEAVLKAARKMVPIAEGTKTSRSLDGKVLSALFFEPSTRTPPRSGRRVR